MRYPPDYMPNAALNHGEDYKRDVNFGKSTPKGCPDPRITCVKAEGRYYEYCKTCGKTLEKWDE